MIYFHQMCDVFFGSHNPSPPRPKTPFTHAVHVNSDIPLSKGHLGSRWGKHLKTNSNTPISSFQYAQKEYRKVLEMKGTSILNILALLL